MGYVIKHVSATGTPYYFNGRPLSPSDVAVRIFDMNATPIHFLAQQGPDWKQTLCPTTPNVLDATLMSYGLATTNAAYLDEAGFNVTIERESYHLLKRLRRALSAHTNT